MKRRWLPTMLAIVVASLAASGCAVKKRDLTPGDYWPERDRWKRAAMGALKDPATWIPAAGAAAMTLGNADEEVSEWAVENTPLFGSPEDADDVSDTLKTATRWAQLGTALAVPSRGGAWEHRIERLALEELILGSNSLVTDQLKEVVGRERPNGEDDRSFPSGHASSSFARAALANRNLDGLGLSRGWRVALKTTFTTLAAGSAWARVEAGVHYPSDVLAGSALGHFLSAFLHDAFLPADGGPRIEFDVQPDEVSASVTFSLTRRKSR